MELILLPRQDSQLEPRDELLPGMTHPTGTPCPFADDGLPLGAGRTCCSMDATRAYRTLDALGEAGVARIVRDCLETSNIHSLTPFVRMVLREAESTYAWHHAELEARSSEGQSELGAEVLGWSADEFDEAITSARKLPDWYEKVARLGFWVHARY